MKQCVWLINSLLLLLLHSSLSTENAGTDNHEPQVQLTPSHVISKRFIPNDQSCDPNLPGSCIRGDFIDKSIADCMYEKSLGTCTASGKTGGIISWVVAPDKNDQCKPIKEHKQFTCGSKGTNTRCICSDYKIQFNHCRCQYWTEESIGCKEPSFCTAYYLGGTTSVHHYVCCDNCNDTTPYSTCDRHTYEGGSSSLYCDSCGLATGGGLTKFQFNCGSCDTQSHCEGVCNHTVGLRLPGFCWRWVNCFRGCCVAAVKATKSKQSKLMKRETISIKTVNMSGVEFCGNGVCGVEESTSSCPLDCCHKVNSGCSVEPNHCTPDCCQMESCCLPINKTRYT